MLIGYARVSTKDQKLELQLDALNKLGCERIYEDRMSGSKADRPGLTKAMEQLREGDTLVVWKLDRLGRSLKQLIDIVQDLKSKQINFKSIVDNVDTSTSTGVFFFNIMASLAQMERDMIIERTSAGLAAARTRGRVGGRKRAMTDSKVVAARALLTSGMIPSQVAKDLNVSIPTLYRWIPASSILN